jgi:UDPglucose--hexose-1-phosphate uridylyltransferase
MTDQELEGFCAVFQETTRRYDLLYGAPFPYVMSFYQAPVKGEHPDYHLHMVLLPPLRQPGLQKFPAGPEIGGGNFMSDTLPEEKAAELRAVDAASFKEIP